MLRFKWFYFFSVLVFNVAFANGELGECIELSGKEVSIPSQLGDINLYKDNDGFHIINKKGEVFDIKNFFCDPLLQKVSAEQLVMFLGRNKSQLTIMKPEEIKKIDTNSLVEVSADDKKALLYKLFGKGCIFVSQMNDGEYVLRAGVQSLDERAIALLQNKTLAKILLIAAPAVYIGIGVLLLNLQLDVQDAGFWRTFNRVLMIEMNLAGRIFVGCGVGMMCGGIFGASYAAIKGRKERSHSDAFMGAGYGLLLGAGVGVGYGLNEFIGRVRIRNTD